MKLRFPDGEWVTVLADKGAVYLIERETGDIFDVPKDILDSGSKSFSAAS